MSIFNKLSPPQQESLLRNVKTTRTLGLVPSFVAIGHVSVLLLNGVESLGRSGVIGWIISFLTLIFLALTVAVIAIVRQKKLVRELADSVGGDPKALLKEARAKKK